MNSKFVRSSKYRHVFGTAFRKELCYENLKVSKNVIDGNLIKVNPKYISVNWAASGGGAFAIIPLQNCGKLPLDYPLFTGHSGPVIDTDFSPFNENLIASASEDSQVMLWSIPEQLPEPQSGAQKAGSPLVILSSHTKKANFVLFHPTAENVLLSCSSDLSLRLWDIQTAQEKLHFTHHPDNVLSLSWNYDGSLLASTCKDKKFRVFDIRSGRIVMETHSHTGVKPSYVAWLGDSNRLITTGFSKTSDRQLCFWDTTKPSGPLKLIDLDSSSGVISPFFDHDSKILFLAGKGDGNIRYYEILNEEPFIYPLSEFKSNEPQRGISFMPKRALNIMENEIARAYKVTSTSVEPISFTVPRKSDLFQADLYPNTVGSEPAMSAQDYFSGHNANPILIDLKKMIGQDKPGNLAPNSYSCLSSTLNSPCSPHFKESVFDKDKTPLGSPPAQGPPLKSRIQEYFSNASGSSSSSSLASQSSSKINYAALKEESCLNSNSTSTSPGGCSPSGSQEFLQRRLSLPPNPSQYKLNVYDKLIANKSSVLKHSFYSTNYSSSPSCSSSPISSSYPSSLASSSSSLNSKPFRGSVEAIEKFIPSSKSLTGLSINGNAGELVNSANGLPPVSSTYIAQIQELKDTLQIIKIDNEALKRAISLKDEKVENLERKIHSFGDIKAKFDFIQDQLADIIKIVHRDQV